MPIIRFLKNWTLPVAMTVGALSYFAYSSIPALESTRPFAAKFVAVFQPSLIFLMLFITFCKINPHDLRLCRWHIPLLLIQSACFALPALMLRLYPQPHYSIFVESFMLCMICPTATAAVVVTSKLGGNAASITTYTILINMLNALLVPAVVPLIHPNQQLTFGLSIILILGKVFPILFCPFLLAILVRRFMPSLQQKVLQHSDTAFYLWAIALAVAIAVTVKSIIHSHEPITALAIIALTSLLCCALQFSLGRTFGKKQHDSISAGQAMGQKNTIFAIWMGYTFLTPITSIAGGLYSIWQNSFNSYQLYQKRKLGSCAPQSPTPTSTDKH